MCCIETKNVYVEKWRTGSSSFFWLFTHNPHRKIPDIHFSVELDRSPFKSLREGTALPVFSIDFAIHGSRCKKKLEDEDSILNRGKGLYRQKGMEFNICLLAIGLQFGLFFK